MWLGIVLLLGYFLKHWRPLGAICEGRSLATFFVLMLHNLYVILNFGSRLQHCALKFGYGFLLSASHAEYLWQVSWKSVYYILSKETSRQARQVLLTDGWTNNGETNGQPNGRPGNIMHLPHIGGGRASTPYRRRMPPPSQHSHIRILSHFIIVFKASLNNHVCSPQSTVAFLTSSSAIAERPRCRAG